MIGCEALPGLPEVRPGDDLAGLLRDAADRIGGLAAADVLVVAHKVVSKAEGRIRVLAEVEVSARAEALAGSLGRPDPRVVQVVLDESEAVVRAERGVLICRTRHGLVCAHAGVDTSNALDGTVVLLPTDPDASARALRAALGCAVVISDSFGRAWRHGQSEVAIGCAGLRPLDDWRGRRDSRGRDLIATWIATADQAAAAADLARTKDSREPAVRLRGLDRHVLPPGEDGPGAASIIRPSAEDLFA